MNGIFPDYVGPDLETKHDSLYPDWVYPVRIVIDLPDGAPFRMITENLKIQEDDEELIEVAIALLALRLGLGGK